MADSFTNPERMVLSQIAAVEAFSGELTCCSTQARKLATCGCSPACTRHLPAAICLWMFSGTKVACCTSCWANHVAGTTTSSPIMVRETAAARFGLLTLASIHRCNGVKTDASAPAQTKEGMQGWAKR